MTNTDLKNAARSNGNGSDNRPATRGPSFTTLLEQFKPQIARALPKHMNADRMVRIALTEFRKNRALNDCTVESIYASIIQGAQLGLEPGLNGRAYLVPYKGECQFIPGWKGLVELANRSGRASVWTGAVFDGDQFEYELGDSPHIRHRPAGEDDPARLLYVYGVGRIRGSEWPVLEVWTNDRVTRHFERYNKVGKRHYAHENWEMYARKIPLLQVLKYLPSSPELETALALDDAAERAGRQGLTIDAAMSNAWTPPSDSGGDDAPPSTDNAPTTRKRSNTGASDAPMFSYAEIADEAGRASTIDELDLARDKASRFTDDEQRTGLLAIISDRETALQGGNDSSMLP